MASLPQNTPSVQLSTIFTEIYAEQQNCAGKIRGTHSAVKTCFYCFGAFGAIWAAGTIAIACAKPFNRMRGVQLTSFFTIVGSIVICCAKRFLNLSAKLKEDIERDYGNIKTYKTTLVEAEEQSFVALFNYYKKKFEFYSAEYAKLIDLAASYKPDIDKPHEGLTRAHFARSQALALVCKVQTAYIQVVIDSIDCQKRPICETLEQLKGKIFTFSDTPFRSSACWIEQETIAFVHFTFFNESLTLKEVNNMTIDAIAMKIQEKMEGTMKILK